MVFLFQPVSQYLPHYWKWIRPLCEPFAYLLVLLVWLKNTSWAWVHSPSPETWCQHWSHDLWRNRSQCNPLRIWREKDYTITCFVSRVYQHKHSRMRNIRKDAMCFWRVLIVLFVFSSVLHTKLTRKLVNPSILDNNIIWVK